MILTGCSWRWRTDSLIYLEEKGDTGTSNHVCLHRQRKKYTRLFKLIPSQKTYDMQRRRNILNYLTWSSSSGENTVTLEEQDDTSASMSRRSSKQTAGTMLIKQQDNLIWPDFWQTTTSGCLWLTAVISEPQMCHCMFTSNAPKTLCEVLHIHTW